jgi:hypothetical protein
MLDRYRHRGQGYTEQCQGPPCRSSTSRRTLRA